MNIPVIAVEEEKIPATQEKKRLESLPVLKPIEAESQDEKFLSNIIRLIEDHLSESELNVNALCELSGISNKQIYRKIKQLTGMSPVEYIKSIRMKKAAMLLQQKKFTVAEVMYMVGFSNHSYFPNVFRLSSEKRRNNICSLLLTKKITINKALAGEDEALIAVFLPFIM